MAGIRGKVSVEKLIFYDTFETDVRQIYFDGAAFGDFMENSQEVSHCDVNRLHGYHPQMDDRTCVWWAWSWRDVIGCVGT
ncbi:hypothetical protein JTE90_008158 [Oedothorax gibbosus]|uniref:Uncharacterized protein n=1 Tax=Oedothorax gibbosus TaxID=931172 RepID=A0AAV6VED4_9ARAC|nr:hypothetical protein JTE90_008158 [Oedothorax gibbosus]